MIKKAYLEITNVCNLSCSFCHKTKRQKHFLTQEEFNTLTDRLAEKIKYLYFHLMGEPTLHPLLPLFISSAKQKNFLPIITTNGSLLGKMGDDLLNTLPHKISISLHAPSANSAFSDTSYLDNCISFARSASAKGCYIAFRLWNLESEDEKENAAILERLRSEFKPPWTDIRNGTGKRIAKNIYLEFAPHFEWPDMNIPDVISSEDNAFCYGLRDQIGILCDGTVVPCCLDSDGALPLGNLFESDLDSILASPAAKAIYDGFSRRRATAPLCRKCGYAKRFSAF